MNRIIKIYWQRSNIHLVFKNNIDGDIYIKKENSYFKLDKVSKNEVSLNVTNTIDNKMLEKGKWLLCFNDDTQIKIDNILLPIIEEKTKTFFYRQNRYAYVVKLETDENLYFSLNIFFMMVNNHYEKFYQVREEKYMKDRLITFIKISSVLCLNLLYKLLHLFKKGKNNILFLTENEDKLTGNLEILFNYLKDDKYNIRVYASNKYSKRKSLLEYLKETYDIALSDYIFVDNYTSILTHINLNKKVKLIQLWHAGLGFKSVGYARFGLNGSPHPYKSCHRNYTHVIVDNEALIPIYSEVFGVSKDIFYSFGMPRLDDYLSKERVDKTTSKLYKMNPLLKNKRTILFAPTYRGMGSGDAYYDYSKIDLEKINVFCHKNNALFIVKMHPFIKENIEIPDEYKDNILDYSNIDINDLMYISDILITDYSSCVYEYSLFKRPIIFYRFDKDIYEYIRKTYTLPIFNDEQYEVKRFGNLISVLEKVINNLKTREIPVNDKLNNSCEKIKQKILGDKDDNNS